MGATFRERLQAAHPELIISDAVLVAYLLADKSRSIGVHLPLSFLHIRQFLIDSAAFSRIGGTENIEEAATYVISSAAADECELSYQIQGGGDLLNSNLHLCV